MLFSEIEEKIPKYGYHSPDRSGVGACPMGQIQRYGSERIVIRYSIVLSIRSCVDKSCLNTTTRYTASSV